MKNKFVSLLDVVKLINDQAISEKYVRYLCGIDKENEYRHREIQDIYLMIEYLQLGHMELDGFVYGYVVPQLNKEFDLIKVTEQACINIELKSQIVDEDKIKNQLIQNKHYLKMFNRSNNYLFTFITSEKILYQLIDEDLVKVPNIKLSEVLSKQQACFFDFDEVFVPKNILVSPLNDMDKFLSGKYLLTENQRNIKNKILEDITGCANSCFIGLTGGPGTGKTLLIYDLVKEISSVKRVLLVHSGILCEGHYRLNESWQNVKIIPAKELRLREIKDVDIVVVDEAHRLYEQILDKIERWVKKAKTVCLFSYDNNQKLTNKIRTNKELALFITCLFDMSKYRKEYVFRNVEIIYEPDLQKAVDLAKRMEQQDGFTYISYTASFYDNALDYQKTDRNTHTVIGQEFENVCMIIDNHFYYDNKKLQAITHPNPDYLFTKLLYQGLTRVRSKMAIIITEKSILDNILEMF